MTKRTADQMDETIKPEEDRQGGVATGSEAESTNNADAKNVQHKPRTTSNYTESNPVKIIFDDAPDGRIFQIHKALLTANSDYFRIALESDKFKEAQTMTFNLSQDEHNADAFGIIAEWFYAGKKFLEEHFAQAINDMNTRETVCNREAQMELVELYVQAASLTIAPLQDHIVEVMRSVLSDSRPCMEALKLLKKVLPYTSPLSTLYNEYLAKFIYKEPVEILKTTSEDKGEERWVELVEKYLKCNGTVTLHILKMLAKDIATERVKKEDEETKPAKIRPRKRR